MLKKQQEEEERRQQEEAERRRKEQEELRKVSWRKITTGLILTFTICLSACLAHGSFYCLHDVLTKNENQKWSVPMKSSQKL